MPDNMLPAPLRFTFRTVGQKLKCSEELQPGNSKRPYIQLGRENLPHFHGIANISPTNKSVGIMQINDQPNNSSNQIIGIPSKSSIEKCFNGSPTQARNNYVFKRRSTTSAAHNQLHASNCSSGNMQPALSSVDSHVQQSAGSFVNLNPDATVGCCFAQTDLGVVVDLGSRPPIPTLIPLSNQPQICIADTQNERFVIPSNSALICSDVIDCQQSKDSNTITCKLMPYPSAVNPVNSQPGLNKLYLSNPCSDNPSTNHFINQLDNSSHGSLMSKGRASYTFKKIPVNCSYSQNSVMHLTGGKTNTLPAVDDKMLRSGTRLNPSSAHLALKPHQTYKTSAKHGCTQVTFPSSQIAGCYVALGSPAISSTTLVQDTINKVDPVDFRSQGYATIESAAPLLLNLLSADSRTENEAVESSGCESTSQDPTMSDSNASNVVGLVGVSGLEIANDVGETSNGQGIVLPKVPKKSAAPRKPRKKSSKSCSEAIVSSSQGESAVNMKSIGSAETGKTTVSSSKVAKGEATSSTTTKKGVIRKRAATKAGSKASSAVKDSTRSDLAADKPCTTGLKSGDFSSEAPEVETDPLLVYFDLETTGLGYSHEITQISCVCPDVSNGGEFNVYTLPMGHFQPMASMITGLTKHGGSLHLHGKAVPTISLQEGLSQLVQWLDALPRRPLLVGHNSRRFDCPRLALALWNNNLLDLVHKNICGFSDSLPALRTLLPSRAEYKLESLLHEYCPNSTESSHNALDDCRALHSVLQEVVRGSTKLPKISGSGIAESLSASVTSASSITTSPGTTMAVSDAPVAAAVCSTTFTNGTVPQRASVAESKEKLGEVDELKSFETMVSDFEQDLIREGLNECLLKEYFSVQTVLESVRRSGPARSVMKTGGS